MPIEHTNMDTALGMLENFDLLGREKAESIVNRISPASIHPSITATIDEVNNRPSVR